jgi:hypothetical protein
MRAAALALLLSFAPFAARAADNVFTDLVVGPTGYLVGDGDDRFIVRGDFLNSSERPEDWSTGEAELVFEGGPGHVCAFPGTNRGPRYAGLDDNFAWGRLRLGTGQSLILQDGDATPGGAQYVRRLVLEDGLPQLALIIGSGMVLYYEASDPENAYLGGVRHELAGGGAVAPYPFASVPALSTRSRVLATALLLVLGATRLGRRQRPPITPVDRS